MPRERCTCLVPIKENSERVPEKSFRTIQGVPLYLYTLTKLVESGLFDEILVETDSSRIKDGVEEAFSNRVRVSRRPDDLIGDSVPMTEIIRHACSSLISTPWVFQTHITTPHLSAQTISNLLEFDLTAAGHDSAFGVSVIQKRLYREDGTPLNHDPQQLRNTQDLEPLLEENSAFYLFPVGLGRSGMRIGSRPLMWQVSDGEAIDIDTEHDMKIAEVWPQVITNESRASWS